MAWEQRDNSGSLWKNDDKTEDSHPNAKGTVMVGGVEYWVSAWTKTTKTGDKFQSLSFKKKDAPKPAEKASDRLKQRVEEEDDLPF